MSRFDVVGRQYNRKPMLNHLVYSPKYNTDLAQFGIDKPFALDRGQMVLNQLSQELDLPLIKVQRGEQAPASAITYEEPLPVDTNEMLLVHTPQYLEKLKDTSTWLEIFDFGADEYSPHKAKLPLPDLIEDIKLKCGGTVRAAEISLSTGLAATLGGGYHHAFPDRGRGFCVLHDIAIAIRSLQKKGLVRKVLVVDLDFHQGDGTAVIFKGDQSVFTMSVHSEEGWPEEKQISSLDLPIREHEAHLYMDRVESGIRQSLWRFAPDLVLYVAGSDPYELDVLPGTKFLRIPIDTMKQRDFYVIDTFADKGIPLAMVFAGGYGPHVWKVHYWATRRLLERSGTFAESTVG